MKLNIRQLIIGILALLIGTLVYLIDRPPEKTYFVNSSPLNISLHGRIPAVFGKIGNTLPDFVHPFAFICMTAALFAPRRRTYLWICLFWFCLDAVFEYGQKHGKWIAGYVPEWFRGIPFLENTANYFRYGSYDPMDMIAITLGCISAYGILLITGKREEIE